MFVDGYAYVHSPTYAQRFPLHLGLYLFVEYLCSFFPLSIQCQNQGSGCYSSTNMWKWKLSVMNITCIQYTVHLFSTLILHPFISFLLSTGVLSISSRLWLSSHGTSLSSEHSYPQCWHILSLEVQVTLWKQVQGFGVNPQKCMKVLENPFISSKTK